MEAKIQSSALRISLPILALLFSFAATGAMAQVTTARLGGIIRDSSGGVIPGVTVVAKNEATGVRHEVVSNDAGLFVLPQLPPGTYTVSCELTGFKRGVVPQVVLQVGDTRS